MSQLDRIVLETKFTTNDAGAIEGIAWDFTSPDRVGDVIEPGAFAGLTGKSIPALFAHDQSQVVGVFDSFVVEPDGLKVKGRLLIETVERAREVRSMIQANAVGGLSIGFMTRKAMPRKGGGRTIQSLDLLETSIVAIPAHPGARITSQKELSMTTAAAETKAVEDLAIELKAANDNIALVTKRLETAETALARPNIIRAANDNEPSAERKAFDLYLRNGKAGMPAEDMKTLTVSSDTQGGYLAPPEMSSEFIRNLVQYSPIRQYASVRSTASPSVVYPARTSVTNALWKGETQPQTGSEPAFGQAEIAVNEINTFVDISNQLLADSGGSAEAEVRLALEEDFGQKEGQAFLTGTGGNQPKGLLAETAIGTTAAAGAAAITFDDFMNLFYSLPAAYRNAPSAAWAFNTQTLLAISKLKDLNGSYIWQPANAQGNGQGQTVLGKPVIEAIEMDSIGTGKVSVIFGDFSGYRIVDRLALSILSNPYLKATEGITRFHATRRVGAGVLQAAKFKKLLHP
ncbi:phage major capsid protein [Rhizobium ruizarguesonis]